MTNLRSLGVSLVKWVQGEPAIAHYLGAVALTALAHYGIHLDANSTGLVLGVLAAGATGLTRSKVTPKAAVSNQSGAVTKEFVVLVFIALCIGAITVHYFGIHVHN